MSFEAGPFGMIAEMCQRKLDKTPLQEPEKSPFFSWWCEVLSVYDEDAMDRFSLRDIADMAFAAGQNYQKALQYEPKVNKKEAQDATVCGTH